MVLGAPIMKILSKSYEPETFIEQTFKRYDLGFKTDSEGRPILLFIGKKDENGAIKGERFARRLKHDQHGNVMKDHWEHKGKTT